MQIDTGIVITSLLAIISLAAWVGALGEKVKQHSKEITNNRDNNREDHAKIFDKLEEINKYIRNGH